MAVEVAQLRVTKLPGTGVVDAQIVQAAEAPQYRIVFDNDSAVAISDLEFDDANSVSCTLNGTPLVKNGITYTLPDLPAGAEITGLCVGPVVQDGDPSYTNTATARGLDPNGESVGPVTDVSEVLVSHISLDKTVFPAVIVAGESVTWTIRVTNDGGTDLRNVVVSDTACGGALSAPSGPGAPTTIARGDSWTYTCTDTPAVDKTNTASVTADPFATVDGQEIMGGPVTDDDQSTVAVTAEPTPHLTVDKSVDQTLIDSGDSVTWTITVTNDGGTPLREVELTDTVCTNISVPSGDGAPDLLDVGDVWTYTCSQVLTQDTTNEASVTDDSFRIIDGVDTPGPSVGGDDEAFVQVTPIPHLTVEKTVDESVVEAGDPVTWTITAENDGEADLRSVSISDAACTGTVSAPSGPGAPTLLAVGDIWTYTCSEAVQADKTNTASVTGESFRTVNGIDFVGPTATDDDDDSVIVIQQSSISLEKSASADVVEIGDDVTWTIVATNDGDADLRDVVLTDTDCSGSMSDPAGPGAPDTLAAGDSWTYTCTEPITADKTNTASITAVPFRIVDGTEITGDPVDAIDDAAVIALGEAHLTVEKSVDDPVVEVGDTVTWTITAENDGEVDLHEVAVTDANCAGTVSAPSGPGAPDILAVADTWTFTCTETVNASKVNTASVTASSFRDDGEGGVIEGIAVDDADDATVTVTVPPLPPAMAATGLDQTNVLWIAASAGILVAAGLVLARRNGQRKR